MNREIRDKVRRLQSDSDRMTGAWINGYRLLGGKLFCTDKCSNCCSLAVHSTWLETLCAGDSIKDDCCLQLDSHLKRLTTIITQSPDFTSFLRMRRQLGPCPFLAEESCSIYPDRPISCRSLLSTKESLWCNADFGTMTGKEKHSFMAGLDRSVVAFPTQYVEATRDAGRNLEDELSGIMKQHFGFSIYGNLPLLVYLNRHHRFEEVVECGYDATVDFLDRVGLNHPYLITISRHKEAEDAGL